MKFKSPWKLTVKGLSRQQLICISPFTSRQQQLSRVFTSSERLNTTPTRRLLEPSHHDSRQSVQEGLASCFVSDRCSWPTVRHASSCTKAPLCAINHVKPAWSYKSLLWGNPPFRFTKWWGVRRSRRNVAGMHLLTDTSRCAEIWFAVWSAGAT